jgi:hypothetical protein
METSEGRSRWYRNFTARIKVSESELLALSSLLFLYISPTIPLICLTKESYCQEANGMCSNRILTANNKHHKSSGGKELIRLSTVNQQGSWWVKLPSFLPFSWALIVESFS